MVAMVTKCVFMTYALRQKTQWDISYDTAAMEGSTPKGETDVWFALRVNIDARIRRLWCQ